jgi:hypothetical protein
VVSDGSLQQANDITLRPHPRGAPLGISSVPHTEAIVVFPDWTGKSSASFFEELCPLVRIELLSREHWDKFFISEL